MQFKIEQIALGALADTPAARELLSAMGLDEWSDDTVRAIGRVHGTIAENVAALAFNYQASGAKALELELLQYTSGKNWVAGSAPCVTHLGMHVTYLELVEWHEFFCSRHIAVAQEVNTISHTNPVIEGKRSYTYVIYDTRAILGVDIKLIARKNYEGSPAVQAP